MEIVNEILTVMGITVGFIAIAFAGFCFTHSKKHKK